MLFQVTVQRVVNIVKKRSPVSWQEPEYERGYEDDLHYGESRYYSDARGYFAEDNFQPNDGRFFDENPDYGNFRRNSPTNRNVSQPCYVHELQAEVHCT